MSAINVVIDGVTYRPITPKLAGRFSFTETMRRLRKGMRWTLDDAASAIGCSKSYLHGMEAGANEPSLRMAYRIAGAYGYPLIDLAHSLGSLQSAKDVLTTVEEAA